MNKGSVSIVILVCTVINLLFEVAAWENERSLAEMHLRSSFALAYSRVRIPGNGEAHGPRSRGLDSEGKEALARI
jgi:hypothetical protein